MSESPASANRSAPPPPDSGQETPDAGRRRTVFGAVAGLGFALLGLAGALWTAMTARFMMPNALAEPPSKFRIGLPQQYPRGHVETRFQERYRAWIVHAEYGGQWQVFALRTVCTHLGCITIWQDAEQRFKCPCHGSAFTMQGINYEGPAPRPLERYAIRIAADGQLEIDRSRIFRQELGQWDDPACFVRV